MPNILTSWTSCTDMVPDILQTWWKDPRKASLQTLRISMALLDVWRDSFQQGCDLWRQTLLQCEKQLRSGTNDNTESTK